MRAAAPAEAAAPATPAAKPKKAARRAAEVARGIPVTTPMMGIYYAAPSPGAPNFVSVGQEVTEGQVVGLVEAMKTFNEILAPQSGVITSVEATNGQLVEPGTVLVRIE
ncbi:MAG TPA: acetyl-CoA carboxylase, biotin carboxyl carrier protein [Armatimonadetes bacterium]|nr:acetyl-CoA carboxylase, biotin carboxyl carrier protein [Armatimonadota bacterium]